MSIVRWEPSRDFMTLSEAMDKLFEESFVGPRRRKWLAPSETTLALHVYETEDSTVVKTSVPGVKPEDIDITISGNPLTISGETKEEEEVKHIARNASSRGAGPGGPLLALPPRTSGARRAPVTDPSPAWRTSRRHGCCRNPRPPWHLGGSLAAAL